jgi:hypothetical protein
MEKGHQESDLFLQMDVEGAEWGVLAVTPSDVLSRFRILIAEFQDLASQIANSKTCEVVQTLVVR